MKTRPNQTASERAPDKANSNTEGELFSELSIENPIPKLKAKAASKFTGTDNPRHLRAIHALMQRARFKNDLQSITGASNTPELVAELRRRGLETPCERVPFLDRDGLVTHPGIYSFNAHDRRKIATWQHARGRA
ncbi:MAG: hypothetical protein Q7U78_05275 [Gallionella sp.]|nr:hypothetical protein [Gallionella sp.]